MKIRLLAVCLGMFAVWTPSARSELREDDEQQRAIEQAISDFKAKRFETALEKLLEAQKRVPASASILNLLGAVYTKKKDFKTALCLLLMRRQDEAEKLPARMKFPGNGPAWHYAHAASQIMEGNTRKAGGLLATAQAIFPGKASLYDETFQDLNWPTR